MRFKTLIRAAFISAIFALTALGINALNSVAVADDSTSARSAAVRDGSHDFDFIYGKWRMPNHRLKKRLAGSHEWEDFITCDEGSPLPGGIGDVDYWKASYIPVVVRYTWTVNPKGMQAGAKWEQALNPKGSPVVAKWEQAFSTDGGKTWETNWYNEFFHDDNCTPTS